MRRVATKIRLFSSGGGWVLTLLLVANAQILAQSDAAPADPATDQAPAAVADEVAGAAPDALPPEKSDRVRRVTITPWSTGVKGKPFKNFPNDEAAHTIQIMLTTELSKIPVFKVVTRDNIEGILSERGLQIAGRAEDTSTATFKEYGKLASVNYFLRFEVTNFETKTSLHAWLIDGASLELDRPNLQQNIQIAYNDSLEELQNDLKVIVGSFAEQFPLEVDVAATDGMSVELQAGTDDGISEDNEVTIILKSDSSEIAKGYVVQATPQRSIVGLESATAPIDPELTVAKVKLLQPAQAALRRGQRYYDAQRFQEAVEAFDKGLRSASTNGELYAGKARALYRLGSTKESLDAFRRALAHRPTDRQLRLDATRARFEAGLFMEVIDDLSREDLAQYPSDVGVYLGMAYDTIGRARVAEDRYRAIERADPNNPRVHLRLALYEMAQGDGHMADRHLARARNLDPGFAEGLLALDVFEGKTEGVEEAIERGDFVALATAAEMLVVGKPEQWRYAADLAGESLTIKSGYLRARLLEAKALSLGGETDDARARLASARKDYPDSFALVWLLAKLTANIGDNWGEAINLARRASELAPGDPRPAELRGNVFTELGGRDLDAAGEYQEAIRLSEGAGGASVDLQAKLGKARVLGQQYGIAIEPLERCVQMAPSRSDCQYYLGMSQFEEGKPDAAFSHLRAAVDHDERHFYLARILEGRMEIGDAMAAYRKCATAGNAYLDKCSERLDELETITARIVDVDEDRRTATIDAGLKHGVEQDMIANVVEIPRTQILIKARKDTTSEGEVSNAKKLGELIGMRVRFRPPRPAGLELRKGAKKGVTLTWNSIDEEEVTQFIVYRSTRRDGLLDEELKRLKVGDESQQTFDDKSAKPGTTYYYTVKALSETGMKSIEADPREIRVE